MNTMIFKIEKKKELLAEIKNIAESQLSDEEKVEKIDKILQDEGYELRVEAL